MTGATVSTHVLDAARGLPASGIAVELFAVAEDGAITRIATATTDADGRTGGPLASGLAPGTYELRFGAGAYFARSGTPAFFDTIPVRFRIAAGDARCHVPLLLSPWSYSTYRGS